MKLYIRPQISITRILPLQMIAASDEGGPSAGDGGGHTPGFNGIKAKKSADDEWDIFGEDENWE